MVTHFLHHNRNAVLPFAALALAFTVQGFSATLTVPTQHATIAAAITAANTGDDIRVRFDHVETSDSNAIAGKNLTIRSYDAAYTTPQAGAGWVLGAGGGGTAGGLMLLSAASGVTFDGFGQVTVPGGNAFVVGTGCSLAVTNTTFSGIGLSNTAGIKADTVDNVSVTVSDCVFNANGRSIWYNNVRGTTSLNVSNVTFTNNTSYTVEWRTNSTGTAAHTFNISDCSTVQATNSPMRIYLFGVTGGNSVTNTVSIDRCKFQMTAPGSHPIMIGGIVDTANPASTANISVTNCLMDLRTAAATAAGVGSLSDNNFRKSNVTVRHCTIITGSATQSGIQLFCDQNPSAWTIDNSIVDGPGFALKNDNSITLPGAGGTITSGKNLFNTAAGIKDGTNQANTTLSGTEITGVSPQFVDAVSATGDFHLQSTSPAVDVATASSVLVDLDGETRPAGSASDLGAYEFVSTASVSNWTLY